MKHNTYCKLCGKIKEAFCCQKCYDIANNDANKEAEMFRTYKADHEGVTAALVEALTDMLEIFDRELGPNTIGKMVCNEARAAIKKVKA